jgi:multiple sugar transport system substrate-binding protein
MWQWGGALADPTGEIVTLYSPETIDAMTWMSDVYLNPANRAILPQGVNSWNDTGNNEAWLAGSIGFTFNAATLWAKSILDDTRLPDGTRLDDVTDAVMAPLGPYGARQQRVSGSGFHFMNGSRNFDAAVELANHFMSPEIYDPMLKISYGYVLPAYAAQWDNPFVFDNKLAKKFKDVVFAEPPFVGLPHRGPPTDAAAAVGQQTVLTGMMGEILAGKPVIAAVRDAHLRCVDIYKAFGLKGR